MASADTDTKIKTDGAAAIVVKREGPSLPKGPPSVPSAQPRSSFQLCKKPKDDTPRPPARAGGSTHPLAARAGGPSMERRAVAVAQARVEPSYRQGKPKHPVVIDLLDDSDEEEEQSPPNARRVDDDFIRRVNVNGHLPSTSEELSDYPSPRSEPLPSYLLPLEGAIEGIRCDVQVIAIYAKLDRGDPISRPTHRLDDRIRRIPRSKFRCRYYSGVAFTADGLHMLRVKLLDDEKEEYAKKKGIALDDVPSFGYVRLEDASRPAPMIGGKPRLTLCPRVILRKKVVVAVSMFDPTNSFLRALCHESFDKSFHLFRYFVTDSNYDADTGDAEQAARMAYVPDNGTGEIVRLPRIHDTTEMSLFANVFGDPAIKELIKLVTHIDQVQFLLFASPRSPVELVQVPIFFERFASAATGALGVGDARRTVHYICGTLPTGAIGNPKDAKIARCFDAVFPTDGVLTFDQGQECASQASRPSRYYCNHLESAQVSGRDLQAVGCRHPRWNVPVNVTIARHQPGFTIVGGDSQRTKLRLGADNKLHAKNQTINVPISIYEDFLGIPLNDVALNGKIQPAKTFHREWLVSKEHSQFHLRYLIESLVDEMCHEALMRNGCSFVARMPREIAADGLEELRRRKISSALDPDALSRVRAEKERDVYECLERAVRDVPTPRTPSSLMDYGYARGGADYTAHMNSYYYRGESTH